MSIVANGWMDEDAAWYGSRPRPMSHCTTWGPSFCERCTAAPLFSAHVYCGHGRPSQLLLSSCYLFQLPALHICYLRQGYCFRRFSLCVCMLVTFCKNCQTDLHDIFREGWQWASEQMIKFWWQSGSQIRIRIATLVRHAFAEVCTVPVLLVFTASVFLVSHTKVIASVDSMLLILLQSSSSIVISSAAVWSFYQTPSH